MATVLFIKRADLVKTTILNGNIDSDKFLPFIEIAQEIHIQNYLGTKLYDKLIADIAGSTLSGNYETLVDDYVQPMLIHWAAAEYLPHAAYTVANGGAYKHTAEGATTMTKEEIDFLTENYRKKAQYYTQRFIDYICFNNDLFPEYNQNTNDDVYPDKNAYRPSWNL